MAITAEQSNQLREKALIDHEFRSRLLTKSKETALELGIELTDEEVTQIEDQAEKLVEIGQKIDTILRPPGWTVPLWRPALGGGQGGGTGPTT